MSGVEDNLPVTRFDGLREPDTSSRRKVPPVVPITLIALGATAVLLPLVLLRRAKPRVKYGALTDDPPPIRRVNARRNPNTLNSNKPSVPHREPPPTSQTKVNPALADAEVPTQSSDSPFYALKAFSIATCIVGASAVVGVLTVRVATGVRNTEEFALYMRSRLQKIAPVLMGRIYRATEPDDHIPVATPETLSVSFPSHPSSHRGTQHLSQNNAEPSYSSSNLDSDVWTRLSRAYEQGGLTAWMAVVSIELEREAEAERIRRHKGAHNAEKNLTA